MERRTNRIWFHAETDMIGSSPELVQLRGSASDSLEVQREYRLTIKNQSAAELKQAYELICSAWKQHVYDAEGAK